MLSLSNQDVTGNIEGLHINNHHWYILHVNMNYKKQLTMLKINVILWTKNQTRQITYHMVNSFCSFMKLFSNP